MANQRALIDIEMFVDVRCGLVSQLVSPQYADVLASTEWYQVRQHDNFEKASSGLVKWEAYKEAYANRNGDTIVASNMTNFIYELRQDIKKALPALERGVEFDALEIYVNFYPYSDLTEDERKIIVQSIQYYMPLPTQVFAEYIPWKDLTVARMERQYEMIAIYDHEEWFKHHMDELLHHKVPANVIMTPRISNLGVDPVVESVAKDPFKARSGFFQEWISLVFLPPRWVCYNEAMFREIHSHRYSGTAPPDDPPPEQVTLPEVGPRQ